MNKCDYELIFAANKGNNWPCIEIFYNSTKISNHCVTSTNNIVEFSLNSDYLQTNDNALTIHYYNKTQDETILTDGKIIADQCLELKNIYIDGILLESWFLTENYYYPQYFSGYLQQVQNAPEKIKSHLIWHFPGKFIIKNLPNVSNFWSWYQNTRQQKVLENLIDPSGQVLNNLRGLTDEDKKLIADIKEILNV